MQIVEDRSLTLQELMSLGIQYYTYTETITKNRKETVRRIFYQVVLKLDYHSNVELKFDGQATYKSNYQLKL